MKSLKRRLLSLFLAMVMVLSLAPGALAADPSVPSVPNDAMWTGGSTSNDHVDHTAKTYSKTDATCKDEGLETWTCECGATTTKKIDKKTEHTAGDDYIIEGGKHYKKCTVCKKKADQGTTCVAASSNKQYTMNATQHQEKCATCGGPVGNFTNHTEGSWTTETNSDRHWKTCTVCNYKVSERNHTTDSWTKDSDGHSGVCKDCNATISKEAHTYNSAGKCTVCEYENDYAGYTISIESSLSLVVGEYDSLNVTVKDKDNRIVTSVGNSDVSWGSSKTTVATVSNKGVVTAKGSGNATITVEWSPVTGYKITDTCNVSVSKADLDVGVTVYDSNPGYALTDDPDEGSKSIAELIDAWADRKDYRYYQVSFDDRDDDINGGYLDADNGWYDEDELDEVIFTPDTLSSSKKSDTVSYRFTIRLDGSSGKEYSGTMTFTVKEGTSSSGGDIIYTASLGEDVYFDVSDFQSFFEDRYDELEYVVFNTSPSNGTLKNEDDKTAGTTTEYYVDPSSRQKGLDGIYFSPKSTMKKSTTVKIDFTATGTRRSSSKQTIDLEGTVSIIYLNDSAKDITYNTTGGKVTLDPKDFNEAYKEATGSKSAPSNLVIEFQNVPTNGTLTYTGGSRDKDLTKSTIKGTRYTTKSSGTNRLAQLTYSGTKGKDTIDYIAYSGGTAQFSGRVVFNGTAAVPQDVVVYYASTAGQPARFSQNDFVTANSAMSKAAKIRFVTPANGTLYLNGSTTAAGIDIAPALLYSVTYQPKAGFNGTDKVVFAAYDASNNLVANGSVNITVAGNPTTSTTPGGTTNPGGVTDVSQFTDVSGNAWYRANLATLVSKGVISGRGDGKFDPKGTVTYGEALKMVLESCGYTAAVGTGSQWAINYKNLAVSKGWISSSVDLNAAISRNATAELAAKVLGVAPVTSGSPFGDEANAYAVALYYTTPQIFVGTTNPNGGKPLFENNKPLLREQVCAVICRVSDYHTQHTTNVMPDGV